MPPPKTNGHGQQRSISSFLDTHDPLADDDLVEPSSRQPYQSASRSSKRSADTYSTSSQAAKRTKTTDNDAERRLLGDYTPDPLGIQIQVPTVRYNKRSVLNGSSFGGLNANLRGHPRANNHTRTSPGYTNSTLSRREKQQTPQTFSSRNRRHSDSEDPAEERRRPTKRRRAGDLIMSREDPLIIEDDDEPIDNVPMLGRHSGIRSSGTLQPRLGDSVSVNEYTGVEDLVRPGSGGSEHRRRLSQASDIFSDVEEEAFTKAATAQRRRESQRAASSPASPKQRRDGTSLHQVEETMRKKFTSSDGSKRNSSMGSPDILHGDSTVRIARSPILDRPKSRRRSDAQDTNKERQHSIRAERAQNGPRAKGYLIETMTHGDFLIPDNEDYLLAIEDQNMNIRSVGSRLSSEPVYSIRLDTIIKATYGGSALMLNLRWSPNKGGKAFIYLQIEKNVWELLLEIQKHTEIKISEKDASWIKKAEKSENLDRYKGKAVQAQQPEATENPLGLQIKSPAPIKSQGHKLKDQLQTNDGGESSKHLGDPNPEHDRRPVSRESLANRTSGDVLDDRKLPAQLPDPSRRVTRGTAREDQSSVDTTTRPTRQPLMPIPFSQTGALGPPWKKPLVFPKTGRKKAEVEFRDLERLDDNEFLNDNLIGFFLRFLEHDLQHRRPDLAKKIYFFNSYFFATLTNTSRAKKGINYEGVQKWTRGVDLFQHDFVVVPINENAHWYVTVICNLAKLLPSAAEPEEKPEAPEPASEMPNPTPPSAGLERIERADEPSKEQITPEQPEPQQQPTEMDIDETDRSFQELNLAEKEPVKAPSDINNHGSILSKLFQKASDNFGIGKASEKSPKSKTKKSARRSGIGLQKYDPSAPIIINMDSLGIGRSPTTKALREYLAEEAKAKLNIDIDSSMIRGMSAKGIPNQNNFSDCGLYLLAYMERFIQDPYQFVTSILRREMNEYRDWPVMESTDLRDRLRQFIMNFHDAQANGEEAPVTDVGHIMLGESRGSTPAAPTVSDPNPTVSKYFDNPKEPEISPIAQPSEKDAALSTTSDSHNIDHHIRASSSSETAGEDQHREPSGKDTETNRSNNLPDELVEPKTEITILSSHEEVPETQQEDNKSNNSFEELKPQ